VSPWPAGPSARSSLNGLHRRAQIPSGNAAGSWIPKTAQTLDTPSPAFPDTQSPAGVLHSKDSQACRKKLSSVVREARNNHRQVMELIYGESLRAAKAPTPTVVSRVGFSVRVAQFDNE
jgi:hypothetical protein